MPKIGRQSSLLEEKFKEQHIQNLCQDENEDWLSLSLLFDAASV